MWPTATCGRSHEARDQDGELAMTVDAAADATALAERDDTVAPRSFARLVGRFAIYALLIIWTFIALFPIYWTLSTSVKLGRDVTQGHLIPWVDFAPS